MSSSFVYEPIHTEYANGKREQLTFREQMGNIGSEVDRCFRAREKGKESRMMNAFWRMIELIDWTRADESKPFLRRWELARAREQLCDIIVGDGEYVKDIPSLQKYFLHFGQVARAMK